MKRRGVMLEAVQEIGLGSPASQLRAAPVSLGSGGAPRGILAAYAADFDVDPYVEMFFFPEDTLKLILFTEQGEVLWKRDLGRGVVPGMWFCPILPFDLDGDDVEEIWFVNNTDPKHPLGVSHYCLERIDARTGETTGQWPWPNRGGNNQSLSHQFRNFLVGGYVRGEPVLVTAQGTYGAMFLQGWNAGMAERWKIAIAADAPGARGSHMCPIVDINGDGVDELMWGERCLSLDDGAELFCADRDVYRGHSDIVQPVLDPESGRWFLYTCRESDGAASPRVVLFDDQGERIWGAVEQGHMDMGWTARLGGEDGRRFAAMAIRIGHKTCGPDGRFHEGRDEFVFDALTGEPLPLPFSVYQTLPVDINGDDVHELVRGIPGGNGDVLDRHGTVLGSVGGPVALASRFLNRPGEHLLSYTPDGIVRLWADRNAEDSDAARARYAHPFYQANQRLTITGSNLNALGGI